MYLPRGNTYHAMVNTHPGYVPTQRKYIPCNGKYPPRVNTRSEERPAPRRDPLKENTYGDFSR